MVLAEHDAGEHQQDPGHLTEREGLGCDESADQDAGDRVQKADDPNGPRAQVTKCGEPCRVGDGRGDQGHIGERRHRGGAELREAALDDDRGRYEDEAACSELPGRDGEDALVAGPALGEGESDRRQNHGREGGRDAHRVNRGGSAEKHHGHSSDADRRSCDSSDARSLRQHEPGDDDHRGRRGSHQRGRDARRESLSGDVHQCEEGPDGQCAEDRRPPPPGPRREPADDQKQDQTGRQSAQH